MAEASRTLVTYLEAPDAETTVRSPQEEVDSWLEQRRYVLPELEEADDLALPSDIKGTEARRILSGYAQAYRDDARTLPMADFEPAAAACDYDPAQLANRFNVPLDLVFRRLAALPLGAGHPEFGLLVCDAAGAVIKAKPIDGFTPNRATTLCPLWPIFSALSQPNVPLRQTVVMPGDQPVVFTCYAVALPQGAVAYGMPARQMATMVLRISAETGANAQPVGPTCRICPRSDCAARREGSILG